MSTVPTRIPEQLKKNGFNYKQIKRGENAAIYEQTDPKTGVIYAHEVFKIKIQKEKLFLGKLMPAQEIFPGNEEFGKSAFSFGYHRGENQERLMEKFNALENEVKPVKK